MEANDVTIEVLKNIRDEIREVRVGVQDTNARLDDTNARLDALARRVVESETAPPPRSPSWPGQSAR